jgi:GrpB-like predicted nucleotidyltransferase (UPF0157 family)
VESPIAIVAYDPEWLSRFAAERELLLETLGPWLVGDIEHVGSTSVPGLAAKPVIDVMAPVASLEQSRPALDRHHLHLVPLGSPLWNEMLAFRDPGPRPAHCMTCAMHR